MQLTYSKIVPTILSVIIIILIFNAAIIEFYYYYYYHYFPLLTSAAKAVSHPIIITQPPPQGPVINPIINDPKLKAEVVFKGLNFPTSMAFLGPNDILVLEKNDGTVRRIVNGIMLPDPLLHVNVANQHERGMLGIAVAKNKDVTGITRTFVFIYYTGQTSNMITNPNFAYIDNRSGTPLYWNDSLNCERLFKCAINSTNGWGDNGKNNTSFQISTNATNKHTLASIRGNEIAVTPGQVYELTTHMKLNQYANYSHVALKAYSQTSNKWYEITQCPSGTNASVGLTWHEYRCTITIPKDVDKVRPVLYAGWSSQPGKQAVTLFDNLRLNLNEVNIHLYRYELVNNTLANPKSFLDLPLLSPRFIHYGGKIVTGPDKNLYIAIGNIGNLQAKTQNNVEGKDPDGTGGILRLGQDGKPLEGILSDKFPLNLYYAYGIRNSFGIDFDPVTKKLWDTENGPAFGDEINLVEPGFNSGHSKVQGMWKPVKYLGTAEEEAGPFVLHPEKDLVDFGGKGKYRSSEFTWLYTVGPTGIRFLNSDKLGKQYENHMFVADANNGNIYHFKLNQNRTGLILNGSLADKVANKPQELQGITFATGFGPITDLEVGPDGYLYVLRFTDPGTIFRIVPIIYIH